MTLVSGRLSLRLTGGVFIEISRTDRGASPGHPSQPPWPYRTGSGSPGSSTARTGGQIEALDINPLICGLMSRASIWPPVRAVEDPGEPEPVRYGQGG